MKNTSLPRFVLAPRCREVGRPSATLQAQINTQSYLRNTRATSEREDPRVQQIIARSEEHFKLGELKPQRPEGARPARERVRKAVDTVLESGMDVRSNPRLQR